MNISQAYPSKAAGVSIALCTCQGGKYLARQLQSLQSQTLRPAELVICDDQSTDDTARVVAEFAHAAPFPVSFNTNPRRLGVTANFQRAFSLCQYPLIAPCDQDDIWEPQKLARLVASFTRDQACLAAFCDASIMTPDGKLTGKTQWGQLRFTPAQVRALNHNQPPDDAFARLLRYNVVTGMTMMFRASLLKIAVPLPEEFIHDEWLSLLAAATGKLTAVPEALVRYRQHPSQKVGPASRQPWSQWRYARAHMGGDYLERQLLRTQKLLERLTQIEAGQVDPTHLNQVHQKIDFLHRRIALRQHVYTRWPRAMKLLAQRQYTRFGHGWRSFAQDLTL